MKAKIQGGFTLIELIVVISILGILAAFAIPKFISVETSARASVVKAIAGSLRSASSLAHALTIANGNGSTSNTSVTMEGATVGMTNGYPSAIGIQQAMTVSDVTVSRAGTTVSYKSSGNTCKATYTASTGANIPPVIATDVSGC